MMDDEDRARPTEPPAAPQPGAAARALAEAEERRAETMRVGQAPAKEIGGRQGPEPVRYGDWENKGIAYDF